MRYNGEREDEYGDLKKNETYRKDGCAFNMVSILFSFNKEIKEENKDERRDKKNSRELICMWVSDFFLNLLKIFHFTCQIQEELHLHNIKLNISIYIIKFNILKNLKFILFIEDL